MRAYIGASYRVSKNVRIGAAIPLQWEAVKHFVQVLAWLWLAGFVLQALGIKS